MSKPNTTALVRMPQSDGLIRALGGLAVCEAPPQVLTDQQLAEMDADRLRALVRDYQSREVTQIRLTPRGALRCVRVRVPLRVGAELTQFDQWDPDAWNEQQQKRGAMVPCPPFINARGYYRLNAVANLQLVLAPKVLVDGVERANPWYITNEKTGAIERIYCRKIGIGRSATGNWIARDHTIVYLPHEYLLEDLHGKERNNKDAIRGFAMSAGATPPDGKFYFPEVFSPDGSQSMGMLIDPGNEAVRQTLKTLAQRKKKALQIAQTQADRDVIKKMLGVSDPPIDARGVGYVTVVGWIESDEDLQRINQLVLQGEDPDKGSQLDAALAQAGISDIEVTTHEVRGDESAERDDMGEEDDVGGDVAAADAVADVAKPAPAPAPARAEPAPSQPAQGIDKAKVAEYMASQKAAAERLAAERPPEPAPAAAPAAAPAPAPAPAPVKADANGQTGLPLETPAQAAVSRMAQAQADITEIEKMAGFLGAEDFLTACADAGVKSGTWKTEAGPRGLARLKAKCSEMLGGREDD